jgi:hypothetical protein
MLFPQPERIAHARERLLRRYAAEQDDAATRGHRQPVAQQLNQWPIALMCAHLPHVAQPIAGCQNVDFATFGMLADLFNHRGH